MPKSRPPYLLGPPQQMVELPGTGRAPGELAQELDATTQPIRDRLRQADDDDGRRHDGLADTHRQEIRRPRCQSASLPFGQAGRKNRASLSMNSLGDAFAKVGTESFCATLDRQLLICAASRPWPPSGARSLSPPSAKPNHIVH